MAITVHSPFSGRPVKIRDQDVGRAVRDEEGRIFYVVPRSSGGYYAAPTRKGSERDEQRYDDLLDKVQRGEVAAQASQATAHDARGPGRPGSKLRAVVLLLILLVIAGVTYYVLMLQGYAPAVPGLPVPAPTQPMLPDEVPVDPTPPLPEAPATPGPSASLLPVADASLLVAPVSASTQPQPTYEVLPSGLRYRIEQPGEGAPAVAGEFVRLNMELALPGGPVLYSSQSQPVSFVLGFGQLGQGMDQGVLGMTPGEQRTLLIPPALLAGFTPGDRYPELPRAALQAKIELVEVLPGVQIRTLEPGDGPKLGRGDRLTFSYVARVDGRQRPFATGDADAPLRFTLGEKKVIPGLELGVLGMAVGERREIAIPPYLAYGPRGFGNVIPPEATLRYEVQLLQRTPAAEPGSAASD